MCFGAYYQKTFVPIFTPLIVFTTNYSFSELRLSAQDNHVGHLKCGENTTYEVCVLKKTDLRLCYHLSDRWEALGWISSLFPFPSSQILSICFFLLSTPPPPSLHLTHFLGLGSWEYCFSERKVLLSVFK